MAQNLDAAVAALRGEMVEDIRRLVAIPSVTGNTAQVGQALGFVLERARAFGMRTFTTREGDVGVAEMGEGDTTVGVLAHVDVVDPGDLSKWTDSPWALTERDGYLYGRGIEDDKGPVMMGLYAMRALLESGLPLDKRIWLIIGTSEEGEWDDIRHFKAQFPLPDFGFTPDNAFPIYNGENGYVDVQMRFAQPGLAALEQLAAGASPNSIPSVASVKMVGQAARTYQGVSSHSAYPHMAKNAIEGMCREDPGLQNYDFARFINHFWAGQAAPAALLGIDDGTPMYKGEEVGHTTVTATILALEADAVFLNLNIRQRFGTTEADIQRAFAALAPKWGFTFRLNDFHAAIRVSPGLPHLQLMDEVQRAYGMGSGFTTTPGTSYAKAMPNTVAWGPVRNKQEATDHQEDERYRAADLVPATQVYCSYLARIAGPGK